jgi:hypothetical protein
MSKSILTQF